MKAINMARVIQDMRDCGDTEEEIAAELGYPTLEEWAAAAGPRSEHVD